MQKPFEVRNVTITLFIALAISYVLCILGGLFFDWTMYKVWVPLLPGFTWPVSASGFLIGLLWIVGYSVYVAILLVVPYNFLVQRKVN